MKRFAIAFLAICSCSQGTGPSAPSILVKGSGGAYGDRWEAYDSLNPGQWNSGWQLVQPADHYCFHPPASTSSVILLDMSAQPGAGTLHEGFVHLSADAEHWMTDGSIAVTGYIFFTTGPGC